jgi:hypothetical protein
VAVLLIRERRGGLKQRKLILASRNNAGQPQDAWAYYGQVSSSGRFVTFLTEQTTNLPGGRLADRDGIEWARA